VQRRYGRALRMYYPDAADVEEWVARTHQRFSRRSRAAPRLLRDPQGAAVPPRRDRPRRLGHRIRRGQSASRALASPVEWDGEYGLFKISPLLDWSEDEIWITFAGSGCRTMCCTTADSPASAARPARAPWSPARTSVGPLVWERADSRECGCIRGVAFQPRPRSAADLVLRLIAARRIPPREDERAP